MPMHNPPHLGDFIRAVYLEPFQISERQLSARLGVAPSTLDRMLNGNIAVSSEMALCLSVALGRSPESWLAMQDRFDLWRARQSADLGGVQKVDFGPAVQTADTT